MWTPSTVPPLSAEQVIMTPLPRNRWQRKSRLASEKARKNWPWYEVDPADAITILLPNNQDQERG
jgi:hypothetical protein